MRPEQVWPRVLYLAERAERHCGCSGILEAAVGVVAWLKLSLKLYHARELRRVYQQLMTEAPHALPGGLPHFGSSGRICGRAKQHG
jgi:hypothetical protein